MIDYVNRIDSAFRQVKYYEFSTIVSSVMNYVLDVLLVEHILFPDLYGRLPVF